MFMIHSSKAHPRFSVLSADGHALAFHHTITVFDVHWEQPELLNNSVFSQGTCSKKRPFKKLSVKYFLPSNIIGTALIQSKATTSSLGLLSKKIANV